MNLAAPKVVLPDQARQAAAGFRAFLALADQWQLAEQDQLALLGGVGRSTFYRWKEHPPSSLDKDRMDRLSLLLGIHRNLMDLFGTAEMRTSWLHSQRPGEPFFEGRTPLRIMTEGTIADLTLVRDYLDAAIEGWA
jgi:uncharacterized protein (DUF2384 family)